MKLGKVEVGSNIINHLAQRKSYLVIIYLNSQEQFTKSEIMSSWSWVRALLKITRLAFRKSYLVIMFPNSY